MTLNHKIENIGEEDWKFLFKNGKRSSELNGIEFNSLCYNTFEFVKHTAPELINKGDFEKLIFNCFIDRKIFIFENDLQYFDLKECLYFLFWIIDELKYWSEMEQQHLSSDPDIEMKASGIDEMNIFGDLNTTDMIAVKYGILPWDVEKWSYQRVFDIQLLEVKKAEFQKKYQKRMSEKSKSKR